MVQNVESVLNRGERLDVLVDRTEDLRDQVGGSSISLALASTCGDLHSLQCMLCV